MTPEELGEYWKYQHDRAFARQGVFPPPNNLYTSRDPHTTLEVDLVVSEGRCGPETSRFFGENPVSPGKTTAIRFTDNSIDVSTHDISVYCIFMTIDSLNDHAMVYKPDISIYPVHAVHYSQDYVREYLMHS